MSGVDTSREAVERIADWVEGSGIVPGQSLPLFDLPDMLRALLDRAEAAEAEARRSWLMVKTITAGAVQLQAALDTARASLATARADALREAAAKAKALRDAWATSVYHDQRNGIAYAEAIRAAILDLIPTGDKT